MEKIIKPIIFNTEMVQGIKARRKTVTRRCIRFPVNRFTRNVPSAGDVSLAHLRSDKATFHEKPFFGFDVKVPFLVDDILYVRETWYKSKSGYMYRADYSENEEFYQNGNEIKIKWKPSIHMPKKAARIFLKVTNVRVERLQDMNKMDAVREGVDTRLCVNLAHALTKFKKIWNSTIKGKELEIYGWDANPYVWVIEFEVFDGKDCCKYGASAEDEEGK